MKDTMLRRIAELEAERERVAQRYHSVAGKIADLEEEKQNLGRLFARFDGAVAELRQLLSTDGEPAAQPAEPTKET